ncbi:MAG: nucleotidyltransferase family protein [Phycisphaeraceae bacterium]|nr:nucleotidyltransferase family protein [Phycisphaeraceae bacterium]
MPSHIPIDPQNIERFCQRHHIAELRLFGSVLREDFQGDSDVDVLVRFEPGHSPGWEIIDIERELGELLGRKVDLMTDIGLKPWWRQEILPRSEVIYVAA